MTTFGFDGRVAVITGAGRGIGRAYARLLAARGASVVVNDLGGSVGGRGADASLSSTTVDEIIVAGGVALADANDVSVVEGANALIASTIDRFGRLDILINNAGIIRWAGPANTDAENLARHLAVHVAGSFNTVRAAWPHMVEARYGRIVMTTSTGMLGLPQNLSYATAKGGVFGMMRSMAVAGAPHGIQVNAIAPAAMTRMAGPGGETVDPADPMSPDLVAPMAAYLAHETCPVSGEVYTAGGGRFARLFIASTEGYVDGSGFPTIEDIAAEWTTINDESGYFVPTDLISWSSAFMAHLPPAIPQPG